MSANNVVPLKSATPKPTKRATVTVHIHDPAAYSQVYDRIFDLIKTLEVECHMTGEPGD